MHSQFRYNMGSVIWNTFIFIDLDWNASVNSPKTWAFTPSETTRETERRSSLGCSSSSSDIFSCKELDLGCLNQAGIVWEFIVRRQRWSTFNPGTRLGALRTTADTISLVSNYCPVHNWNKSIHVFQCWIQYMRLAYKGEINEEVEYWHVTARKCIIDYHKA